MNDDRKRPSRDSEEKNHPTGRSRQPQSEARPGGDRESNIASSGTTHGGDAGEIRDLSDVPGPEDLED